MKLVRKWLFPVLTCLIVTGAAVLPPCISQARDAEQFGRAHAEELAADALPVYEPPGLTDRITLYAKSMTEYPVLCYDTSVYYDDPMREEQIRSAQKTLMEAELLPDYFFLEEPFEDFTPIIVSRTLLWDPADDSLWQEPSSFVGVLGEYHSRDGAHYKNFTVRIDEQSGLPIELHVLDTNMTRWLPYQFDAVRYFAERYFELLDLDVQPSDPLYPEADTIVLWFSVTGTDIFCSVEHAGTMLSVRPHMEWTGGVFDSGGYDG